ncbi:response regulator transcription factor [Chryseobacterium viscerum]|uniref:Response regulator n=1 Tax=Chryseobacterium viscerum TaxID=1037377 RepID=A0A316WIU5_9FLAO|nr:response regulator [Chryseobacterium viscerum]PWN58370.1 response regulator [Chryseobacterium viscerum]
MKTVCILEDNENIKEVLEILLESENYQVESCTNVSDFYSKTKALRTDLFILDVMLPDGSGIDVCNFLRKTTEFSKTPIIMMSANTDAIKTNKSCRPNAFISKPFDLDMVLEKVAALMGGHS